MIQPEGFLSDIDRLLQAELAGQFEAGSSLVTQSPRLFFARLSIAASSKDSSNANDLKDLALALELLGVGFFLHYEKDQRELVLGDLFYAKALNLVARLGDAAYAQRLAQTIKEVAELLLEEDAGRPKPWLERLAASSLYLGGLLSGKSSSELKKLERIGELICSRDSLSAKASAEFKEALAALLKSNDYDGLKSLMEEENLFDLSETRNS